jgi:hypothetical protein
LGFCFDDNDDDSDEKLDDNEESKNEPLQKLNLDNKFLKEDL